MSGSHLGGGLVGSSATGPGRMGLERRACYFPAGGCWREDGDRWVGRWMQGVGSVVVDV